MTFSDKLIKKIRQINDGSKNSLDLADKLIKFRSLELDVNNEDNNSKLSEWVDDFFENIDAILSDTEPSTNPDIAGVLYSLADAIFSLQQNHLNDHITTKSIQYYLKAGDVLNKVNYFETALDYYNAAIHLAEKINDTALISTISNSIDKLEIKHRSSILTNVSKSYGAQLEEDKSGLPQWKLYRQKLYDIRDEIFKIHNDPKSDIRSTLKILSENYIKFLDLIFNNCKNMLADVLLKVPASPPGEIAILALGSIGHEVSQPYSDVEYTVLTDFDIEKNVYFDSLIKLLQFSVQSIGETQAERIPFKFPSGFHFDTGANPLAQGELIGPPAKVVNNLLKSGIMKYNVSCPSSLINATFICGNKGLFKAYRSLVIERLCASKSISSSPDADNERPICGLAINQIIDNLREFYIFSKKFDLAPNVDVKREMYSPFVNFINGLCLYHNIVPDSPFHAIEILGTLLFSNALTKDLYHYLELLCDFRFRNHFNHKEQFESVLKENKHDPLSRLYTQLDLKFRTTIIHVIIFFNLLFKNQNGTDIKKFFGNKAQKLDIADCSDYIASFYSNQAKLELTSAREAKKSTFMSIFFKSSDNLNAFNRALDQAMEQQQITPFCTLDDFLDWHHGNDPSIRDIVKGVLQDAPVQSSKAGPFMP